MVVLSTCCVLVHTCCRAWATNTIHAHAQPAQPRFLTHPLQDCNGSGDDEETHADAAQQQPGGAFACLLALQALCAADAAVATPTSDPQRFLRSLHHYVAAASLQQGVLARTTSGPQQPADDGARRGAEEALCLLEVLRCLLVSLGAAERDVLVQLSGDVVSLINRQRYLQLIAAGCQLLCTLAPLHAPAVASVSQLVAKCYSLALCALTGDAAVSSHTPGVAAQTGTPASPAHLQIAPKCVINSAAAATTAAACHCGGGQQPCTAVF